MKIEHIMSRDIIAVEKNTSLNEIASIMKERDIGFLPIYENKKIIGIITDRDIVTRILANNDNELKDYYTKDILSISYDEEITKALELMVEHKVKRLLVTNGKKVVGVLSLSDIYSHVKEEKILKAIETIWTIYRNTDKYRTKIEEFEL